jgi:hypothetical protein
MRFYAHDALSPVQIPLVPHSPVQAKFDNGLELIGISNGKTAVPQPHSPFPN